MAGNGKHAAHSAPNKKLLVGIAIAAVVVAVVALFFVIRSITGKPAEPTDPVDPAPVETPTVVRYTVTVTSAGETLSVREVGENDSFTLPAAPLAEENTVFDGWQTPDGQLHQPGDALTVTADLTVTAQWTEVEPEPEKFAVTLISYEETLSSEELEENTEYTVPEAPEAKAYTQFLAWQDAEGNDHAPGEVLTITAPLTLTAQWEELEPPYTGPRNPLTGMPVAEDLSGKRPYAVMLNNIRVATPQAGVSKVDILFEVPVEGGITRMMGVYQDIAQVGTIGSVRSARPYYIDLAQGLDAIYIHAGGSPEAYTILSNRNVTHIDGVLGSGETFFRDSWRKANMGSEHSLMLDPSLLPTYVEKHKVKTSHADGYEMKLNFADEAAPSTASAQTISLTFLGSKTTTLTYDAETKLYGLSQYGGKMTDSADGSQVKVRNVIALYTTINRIAGDEAGRLRATINGSGSGYLAVDGTYTQINWKKDSATSPYTFTLQDGTPITLGYGSTYVAILPLSVKNAAVFK